MALMKLGIDLGGTKIEGLVLDDDGRELGRQRQPTPSGDYDGTVRAVGAIVEALAAAHGVAPDTPLGVGIPGAVSPKTGLVKNANSTCLIGRALDRDLAEALGRPVRLANDADCFTISEAADGAGADARVVFGVILGTGVGGGISIERKLWVGPNAITGEWGHNPLPWMQPGTALPYFEDERPGPACYCGKHGCIETFLSGPGLTADFARAGGGRMAPAAIVEAAGKGDAAARAAMDRYHRRLARALAGVVNILDPDVIVLGGGLSNIQSLYETVPKLWADWVFSDACDTQLRRNRWGDSSGVRGAAWLWP
jgi:fructokinase